MISAKEEEIRYLDKIKNRLISEIADSNQSLSAQAAEMKELKSYLWENKAELDNKEQFTINRSVQRVAGTGDHLALYRNRLQKLLLSPYFGRFDFIQNNAGTMETFYLGVTSFFDSKIKKNIIYDWRAPISSIYYDSETGPVEYDSPAGIIVGKVTLKRQYRIKNGHLEFMLESSLNIHDNILQKELSNSSDDKMKNIVATIQRDQNKIIRNDSYSLVVQGVAGSGKTSIALHRIAFLLYRHKNRITSNDVLILSPNRVFSDYISNVLPELGEERIPETSIEIIANNLLDGKYKFQTFIEQVTTIIECSDKDYIRRTKYKSSIEFVKKLRKYLIYIEEHYFCPVDSIFFKHPIPSSFINERFKAYHRLPIAKRFSEIANDIAEKIKYESKKELKVSEITEIRKQVQKMFKFSTSLLLYKDFFKWLDEPDLFKVLKNNKLEFSDVFSILYLKLKFEGFKPYYNVKHLLIDEMQDYTPIQYEVLSALFPCKKTILGDTNQIINPYSSVNLDQITSIFPNTELIKLCKSYRSTFEITQFAQKILPNSDLEAYNRLGKEPDIIAVQNLEEEVEEIKKIMTTSKSEDFNSLGIICKTQDQADWFFDQLKTSSIPVKLLNANSTTFSNGIIICSIHLSKGLEFDYVILPQCSSSNYKSNLDRNLLYIGCTRAMHKLTLIYSGEKSEFLPE